MVRMNFQIRWWPETENLSSDPEHCEIGCVTHEKTRIEFSIRVYEILPRRCRLGGSPVPFQSRVDDRRHSV
jgi:hypothetical protein